MKITICGSIVFQDEVLSVKEKLEARGVEFRKAVYIAPSAFPNEDGYCERPN